MITDKTIYLMEKHLENQLNESEIIEFNQLIETNPELKGELEEQKRMKEVLKIMTLKNPPKEIWDNYWIGIYNRLERGIAWIAILIGAALLSVYGSLKFIEKFFVDSNIPVIIKIAVVILIFGVFMLLFSLIREKISVSSGDKYKEIQR